MGKKLENIRENLKPSCIVKHCIIFMLFLIFIVDGICTSEFISRDDKKGIKQSAALERTMDIIKIQNEHFDIEKHLSSNFDNHDKENAAVLQFDMNKYKDMEDMIFDFDDSIKYDSITIREDKYNAYDVAISSADLCLRFIRAFGNLQAKRLTIGSIYPPCDLSLSNNLVKSSIFENTLDVKEIVFEDVCKRFALTVLGLFKFKNPITVVFKNTHLYTYDTLEDFKAPESLSKSISNIEQITFDRVQYFISINILENLRFKEAVKITYDDKNKNFAKYYWNYLTWLPRFHTYKMIEMFKIEDFCALNETQKESLKEILPVLYIRCKRNMKSDGLCSELKNILERSKFFFDETRVSEYPNVKEQFELIHSSSRYKYLILDATSIYTDLKDYPSDEHEMFRKQAEEGVPCHYNYIRPAHSFEVKIIVKCEIFTPFSLQRVLQWASEHINDATKITILFVGCLYKDVSVFESMRIDVENMPYLEHISLRDYWSLSYIHSIVIRDINCKEKYVTNMTTFDLSQKYILALPLNLYVHGNIEQQNKSYPIEYPTTETADILTICKKCDLNVFNPQGGQEESKSTDKVLSLEEIKSMSWNEFLDTPNRENIQNHVMAAYDLDRDISLNEGNFMQVINYVFEKPIVVLPKCLHTICAGCLHEKIRVKEAIECLACKEEPELSCSFRYLVREENINSIKEKYIYSADFYGRQNQETHYILYECAAFQTSRYYFESLSELTKPNFIIRNDKSITLNEREPMEEKTIISV